jgi:hypothetical protein
MGGWRGIALGICFVVIGCVTSGPLSWALVIIGGMVVGLSAAERWA